MKELFQGLQNQINTIDEELVYLLFRRHTIEQELNNLSKTENIEIDQEARKQELLDIMLEEARDKGVDTQLVEEIHELIYKYRYLSP